MSFNTKISNALLNISLHQQLDLTYNSLIYEQRAIVNAGPFLSEEFMRSGASVADYIINEDILSNFMGGLRQIFGRNPTRKDIVAYLDRLPPEKKKLALNTLGDAKKREGQQEKLKQIANSVRNSYLQSIDDLSRKLYARADNNTKTVISKLHSDLKAGIQKWQPKLYDPSKGGTKFDPSKMGLDTGDAYAAGI